MIQQEQGLEEDVCVWYLAKILKCVQLIHWCKYRNFHGNLKSSNIFLDKNYELEAVGDFYMKGITGFQIDDYDLNTLEYLTPEYILGS